MSYKITSAFLLVLLTTLCNVSLAKHPAPNPQTVHQQIIAAAQKQDFQAAFTLLKPLAEQGDAAAQHNLAVFYQDGLGVSADARQALYWYEQAAAQGLAESQFMAGLMYSDGMGTPQDYTKAAHWYAQAAVQGHDEAQNNLAARYATGTGVNKDMATAKRWYARAAKQGNRQAAFTLEQLNHLEQTDKTDKK